MSETFHDRLRRLREEKGFSMRHLAKKIGVPETTYHEWEYGRAIQGQPYEALAQALGVSLRELLTGEKSSSQAVLNALDEIEKSLQTFRRSLIDYL